MEITGVHGVSKYSTVVCQSYIPELSLFEKCSFNPACMEQQGSQSIGSFHVPRQTPSPARMSLTTHNQIHNICLSNGSMDFSCQPKDWIIEGRDSSWYFNVHVVVGYSYHAVHGVPTTAKAVMTMMDIGTPEN